MGWLDKVTDTVSKPFKDAGESIGKSLGGSSGRKIGSKIGGAMALPATSGLKAHQAATGMAQQGMGAAGGMVTGGMTPGGAQALPPTGLDQQLTSLNQSYAGIASAMGGFDPRREQMTGGLAADIGPGASTQLGSTNIQQLAQSLAQNYGLAIGRGNIVDAQGNFLVTPDQLASASGDTVGEASAKMNYIAQAISRQQTEQKQQQGIAAIQTGLGQVQQRGRGSLASLQTGLYQDLADLYSNQEYEAADFSYFIQKEQMDMANELMRRQEKLAKKQSRSGFLGGVGQGVLGAFTGNWGMVASGIGQAFGNAGGTGWF